MRRNAEAEGLANHVADQAIQIGVRRSYIAGGIVEERLTTPYTNHIEWSSIAKSPNAAIELIDGNHRVTLIQEKFGKQVFLLNEYKSNVHKVTTPRERSDLAKKITKLENLVKNDGVWLAEVFDLGNLDCLFVINMFTKKLS